VIVPTVNASAARPINDQQRFRMRRIIDAAQAGVVDRCG
jgi:hypothetical protein